VKDFVLEFIFQDPAKLKKEKSNTDLDTALEFIQAEACQIFTIGINLFFPQEIDQAKFVLDLLRSKHRDSGRKLLLDSLLNLFANHPNPSHLVLPKESHPFPFSPEPLLIPMISLLLKEAHDSSLPNTPNSVPLYLSSSPPVRLLMAIQRDLLIRAEQSLELDLPMQALLAYAKVVLENCRSILETLLELDASNQLPKAMDACVQDIECSVLGILLPTLTNSLLLFSFHMWLAKELLPSIIDIIRVVDAVNGKLPKLSSEELLFIQKRNEFVEGPTRIAECPHPYPAIFTQQTVSIPGAVFLSLIFDERCSTGGPEDFLQLYQDEDCNVPIGDKYFGDGLNSSWPKRRIFVPGNTVVFMFRAQNAERGWGYRCVVIGHMPNSEKHSIPWSIHLEKTLCCLGGQFAALLISGNQVSEIEELHGSVLHLPFLSGGVLESDSNILDGQTSVSKFISVKDIDPPILTNDMADYHKERILCLQLAGEGTIYSTSTSSSETSNASGVVKLIEAMEKKHFKLLANNLQVIKEAQLAVLACLIYHNHLAEEAAALIAELQKEEGSGEFHPSERFLHTWRLISKVREAIIQKHQEIQLNSAIEEEINVAMNRRYSLSAQSQLREASYKKIADQIVQKAHFLLHTIPCKTSSPPLPPHEDVSLSILGFLFQPLPFETLQQLFVSKRHRALSRIVGLQSMQKIFASSNYPTMKHEALCFLGPALRSSGMTHHSSPQHYLDHLEGAGQTLLRAVSVAFASLMTDVAQLLHSNDPMLQLLALDPWAFKLRHCDHHFLQKIDLFRIVYRLSCSSEAGGGGAGAEGDPSDKQVRDKVRKCAKTLFYLLGAMCLSPDIDNVDEEDRCDALHDSFFSCLAEELETTYFATRNQPPHGGGGGFLREDPSSTESDEWLDRIAFLFSISGVQVTKTALCRQRFLRIFFSLLQTSDPKLQLLTLRLFRNILPSQHPEFLTVQKGKGFIKIFFEMIGSINCLYPEFEQLDHKYPVVKSFVSALLVNPPKTGEKTRDRRSLAVSHPFFPFNIPSFTLPAGWDRKSGKGSFTLSEDNRTVAFTPYACFFLSRFFFFFCLTIFNSTEAKRRRMHSFARTYSFQLQFPCSTLRFVWRKSEMGILPPLFFSPSFLSRLFLMLSEIKG
jgi:hypothetical protein